MAKKPLCVAFLWHMHQPDYRNAQTGNMYLPWTRFHAVKDYYDMGALAEQVQGVRLTINVVPSLIDQLIAYGTGELCEECAELTLRDASDLDQQEKAFLLRTFFQLSTKHMVLPYLRYRELLKRRGNPDDQGVYSTGLKLYTTQDYRDLQLWYNLSWCGQVLRRDPEIAGLFAKGRGFTEADKKRLLEVQHSFVSGIIPYYRKLSETHKIEFSVSPYYHPILPLLCDLRSALESLPSIALPSDPFTFPEDAREHIHRALVTYTECLGNTARGMWPSEGAISNEVLLLAQEAGFQWVASDESVLWNSLQKEGRAGIPLPPEKKYCAYQWGSAKTGPYVFFRDHALSDLIGFAYHQWSAEEAVADFVGRLRTIHQSLPDDGRHFIVPVILDGENAWEHYPQNGTKFLGLLYGRLAESRDIRTVTYSDFLDLETHREPLNSVVSGSWIYGNLATWIGHREKNLAWEAMAEARRFLGACRLQNRDTQKTEMAFKEIMIAEGSDWFWWYGDDHQTENAAEFDELFRGHLKKAYRLLDEAPPLKLDEPIKKTHITPQYQDPVHTITPKLDGIVTDYFEWLSAGFAISRGGGSMHRTETFLEKIFFGFDKHSFYIRIDPAPIKIAELPPTCAIQVQFKTPIACSLALEYKKNHEWICRLIHWPLLDSVPRFAGYKILELGIPLEALGLGDPVDVTFFVVVLDNEREMERFPPTGFFVVHADPRSLEQQEWIV